MPDTTAGCEQTARADGLAAGLALALAGTDAGAAPGRVAAVPHTDLPPGAAVLPHRLAGLEGVALLRCDRSAPAGTLTALGARLAAVRLGITLALVATAVEHLSGRTSGGEALIRKQLVAGTLADALTGAETVRRVVRIAGTVPAAVVDAHDRLTILDWEVSKLLGASGWLADGPARSAYVSRLVANCWVDRRGGTP